MLFTTNIEPRWHKLQDRDFGFMNVLDRSFAQAETSGAIHYPDLRRDDRILVFSDFSGQHKESGYNISSFLFVPPSSLPSWDQRWRPVRELYLRDGRRISYKNLSDKIRRRVLARFLASAGGIDGLLVSIAIRKQVESIFKKTGRIQPEEVEMPELQSWDSQTIERLLSSIHIVSLFLSGLSRANQDIIWITDEDDIAANPGRLRTVCDVFARVSSHYLPHPMGQFRFGTANLDDGSRMIEDLIAIPDLASGAICDTFTMYEKGKININSPLIVPPPDGIKPKTIVIQNWLSDPDIKLGRITYVIELASDGTSLVGKRIKFWGSNMAA